MKPLLLPAAALLAGLGSAPATDYTADRSLRVVTTLSLSMDAPDTTMEVNGEERAGRGGGPSAETRTIEELFRVMKHAEGAPTVVRRAFGDVSRATSSEFRGEPQEGEVEGALTDVTLEVTLDDGDVICEVVDGEEPEAEAALEGHDLTLALDGLLPDSEVEDEATWELDEDAIRRALQLDLEGAYFPRPEREESEGERGGGRRGGRGGAGPRGQSTWAELAGAEWEGTATFLGEDEHEGLACVAIQLELEAEGELPERAPRGGGRRGRAFGLLTAPTVNENTIEAQLEGRLLFSVDEGYPLLLELEGTVSTFRDNEFGDGERTMRTVSSQSGEIELVVIVTPEPNDEED